MSLYDAYPTSYQRDRQARADAAMDAWQSTLANIHAPERRRAELAELFAQDPEARVLYCLDTILTIADCERVLWQGVPDGATCLIPRVDTGHRLLSARESCTYEDAQGLDFAIVSIYGDWYAGRAGYIVAKVFDLRSPSGIPPEALCKDIRGRGKKKPSFIELQKPLCLYGDNFLRLDPGEWPRSLSDLDKQLPGAFKLGVLRNGIGNPL